MAPFFACLSRHGVQPTPLNSTSLHGDQLRDPRLVRKEIQAKIACIPELPRSQQGSGEQFRRRFQQR